MDLPDKKGIWLRFTSMEQLYPQNILERHFPILREQRERREREEGDEEVRSEADAYALDVGREASLHENEPLAAGSVGRSLNTIA